MKTAFVYVSGRLQRLESVRSGESASEFFYGSEQMMAQGHEVGLFEVSNDVARSKSERVVDVLFSCGLLPNRTRGAVLMGTKQLLPELNKYDVVVATATGISFSLCIWKALGLFKPEVVAIQCGIFNYRPNWLRRAQIRMLLNSMWSVLFGEGELEEMIRVFGTPRHRMKVNYFGVDTGFWCPASAATNKGCILSVGNDFRRDYGLLLRVAAAMPSRKFVILTRIKIEQAVPPNVEIRGSSWHTEALTDMQLRALYREAACVVLPLKESHQPSGQSVALQAMACGKPVILTRTAGLWHKELMKDGENVMMAPPGDAEALKKAIETIAASDSQPAAMLSANGRRLVCEHFRIQNFAAGIESMCRDALKAKGEKR
jgi:glycosyltransferase involved in cell wall biosynthesis